MEILDDLVERHECALRNFAWSLTGSDNLIDDLLQEVWIKAFSHLDTLSSLNDQKQRSWLFTVLKNRFLDDCRRQKTEKVKLKLVDVYTPDEVKEIYNWEPYLEQLKQKESDIIKMRFWEGLNSREIGKKLNMPEGTVRAHLSNGLKTLKNICERKWR